MSKRSFQGRRAVGCTGIALAAGGFDTVWRLVRPWKFGHPPNISIAIAVAGHSATSLASEVINDNPRSWANATNSPSYAEPRVPATRLSMRTEETAYSYPASGLRLCP